MIGAELGISRMEQDNANLLLELETRKLVERGKGTKDHLQNIRNLFADPPP